METRGRYILVGVFVLTLLVGIFVSIVWLTRGQFQREGQIYDIFFRGSVSGLSEGAPVRYKGVLIGRVLTIRLDPDNVERIRVRIEVDTGTPIKEDAVASLELQGITGQAFVQITGGSNASPPVATPPGRSYPVIASRPSQLEEVVASAPELLNRFIRLTDHLNALLSEENRGAITKALTDLDLVLGEENRTAITKALSDLDTVTSAMARRSQDIDHMIGDAAATMAALREASESANATITRLGKRLTDKDGILDRADAALDDLDRTTKAVQQMAGHLDATVQENRQALRDFTQRGLGDTTQLVAEARTLIVTLNRVAEQFERDPARFLLGDRREGYKPR